MRRKTIAIATLGRTSDGMPTAAAPLPPAQRTAPPPDWRRTTPPATETSPPLAGCARRKAHLSGASARAVVGCAGIDMRVCGVHGGARPPILRLLRHTH